VAALEMDMEPVREMVAAFRERRDRVLERLNAIDDVHCPTPGGAFYLFPQVDAYFGTTAPDGRSINTSEDLCFYVLEEHHVALVHGDAFGAPRGLRISYAASMDELETALDRLEAGFSALRG
jgi:aspartate/methionine/tyrosine aminotransferase